MRLLIDVDPRRVAELTKSLTCEARAYQETPGPSELDFVIAKLAEQAAAIEALDKVVEGLA